MFFDGGEDSQNELAGPESSSKDPYGSFRPFVIVFYCHCKKSCFFFFYCFFVSFRFIEPNRLLGFRHDDTPAVFARRTRRAEGPPVGGREGSEGRREREKKTHNSRRIIVLVGSHQTAFREHRRDIYNNVFARKPYEKRNY